MPKERQILSSHFKALHYSLNLFPNPSPPFTFQGHVSITLKQEIRGQKTIILNGKDLKIHSSSLVPLPSTSTLAAKQLATNFEYSKETVTIGFQNEIPDAENILLHIEFEGVHKENLCGFYRSSRTDNQGAKQTILSTHFEPSDARRVFPCFDEPNLKATFDVTLHVPKGLMALSNMNVVEERTVDINGVALQKFSFATTPLMSTYLLAFVVGRFDKVEKMATLTEKQIPCTVYTDPLKAEEGAFAADLACKVTEFFSQYFGLAYPLPKMDLIGIHDFPIGAMENFGLLTFRVDRLMTNPSTSKERKVVIAYIIAHEIAHQWFGNLVTMKWWDELWLKEGFATYVGWLAIDHIFPEWDIFTHFLDTETSGGFLLDSLAASHPIRVDVASPSEVGEIFDAISYNKGAAVIRMLECFIGRKVFANGVSNYLQKHAFSNATAADLWSALSDASGQGIAKLMHLWTEQTGFPVLEVIAEVFDESAQEVILEIKQERFMSSGEETLADTTWTVPIGVVTSSSSIPVYRILESKQGEIRFPYQKTADSFWKLNFESAGFYYCHYSQPQLEALSNAIVKQNNCLSARDKYGLLFELFALCKAGKISLSYVLTFIKSFKDESDYYVLNLIFGEIRKLMSLFSSHSHVMDQLNALLKTIFAEKLEKVGFEFDPNEDFKKTLGRVLVIDALKTCKDQRVIQTLYSLFQRYIHGDKAALSSDIISIACSCAIQHSTDPDDFDKLLALYKSSTDIELRLIILSDGLTSASDPKLIRKWFDEVLINPELVRTQDIVMALRGLNKCCQVNRAAVMEMKWTWFVENLQVLKERSGRKLLPIPEIFEGIVGMKFYDRIRLWCEGEGLPVEAAARLRSDLESSKRQIEQGLEKLKADSAFVENN